MAPLFSLLLLILPMTRAHIYLEPDYRNCSVSTHVCVRSEECDEYKVKLDEKNSLNEGSEAYKDKLEEIRNMICNKKERGVCCVDPTPFSVNSPFYKGSKCCSACEWHPRRKMCVKKGSSNKCRCND